MVAIVELVVAIVGLVVVVELVAGVSHFYSVTHSELHSQRKKMLNKLKPGM